MSRGCLGVPLLLDYGLPVTMNPPKCCCWCRRAILALPQHGTVPCKLDQESRSIHEGCPSPGGAGVGDTSGTEATVERLSWR